MPGPVTPTALPTAVHPVENIEGPTHWVSLNVMAAGRSFNWQTEALDSSGTPLLRLDDAATEALFSLYASSIRWSPSERAAVVTLDDSHVVLPPGVRDIRDANGRPVQLDAPLLLRDGAAWLPLSALPHLLPGKLQQASANRYVFDPVVSALDLETPEGGGVRLTITSRVDMQYTSFYLRHPDRYVLNIPNVVLDLDRYHKENRVLTHPEIGQIRFDQFSFQPNVVRVVLPLGDNRELQVLPRSTPRKLVVSIHQPTVQAHLEDLSPQRITGVDVSHSASGVRVTLRASGPFQYEWHRLKAPDNRFFLDIPQVTMAVPRRDLDIHDPVISTVQVGQYQRTPPTVRVMLELERPLATRLYSPPGKSNMLVLEVSHHVLASNSETLRGYGFVGGAAAVSPPARHEHHHHHVPIGPRPTEAFVQNGGGRIVCIDPGHGGSDPGAMNASLGINEKTITLEIARKLAAVLRANGWRVVMTRNSDRDVTYPGSSNSEELWARVRVATDFHASMFISIHCNSSVSSMVNGSATHWYKPGDRLLAASVQPHVVEAMGSRNNGLQRNRFYVLTHSRLPSILIETAFISNMSEGRKLADPACQQRLAEGIASGLRTYVAGSHTHGYSYLAYHPHSNKSRSKRSK
jgi:N-acetylmuramoyl-L-alanine amidase